MGASENVRVVLRVRPLTRKEVDRGEEELIRVSSETSVQIIDLANKGGGAGRAHTALAYEFEQCFGTECSQDELFQRCGVQALLSHVCEGYSSTVLAYGPTGSGKTFTIAGKPDNIIKQGSGEASDGIVIRAVESLFGKIRELQRDGLQFKVRASCVEIYNESVIDLVKFSRQSRQCEHLPVKFDTARASFFVQDLSYGKCPSEEELLRLYMKTLRNRSVAAHQLNRDSSRSHSIFTIYVDSMVRGESGHITTRHGKISFVDLAGSERLKESKSVGVQLTETGNINKSLFTLGKVISSLCDRKKVRAPFRDSKLTQLLMDSIGGTSMTLMMVNISPAASHVNESMRTLDYANKAKSIKNKPVVLLDPQENMVQALKKEIDQLRAENRALREALSLGAHDGQSLHLEATLPSLNLHQSQGSMPRSLSAPRASTHLPALAEGQATGESDRIRHYNRSASVGRALQGPQTLPPAAGRAPSGVTAGAPRRIEHIKVVRPRSASRPSSGSRSLSRPGSASRTPQGSAAAHRVEWGGETWQTLGVNGVAKALNVRSRGGQEGDLEEEAAGVGARSNGLKQWQALKQSSTFKSELEVQGLQQLSSLSKYSYFQSGDSSLIAQEAAAAAARLRCELEQRKVVGGTGIDEAIDETLPPEWPQDYAHRVLSLQSRQEPSPSREVSQRNQARDQTAGSIVAANVGVRPQGQSPAPPARSDAADIMHNAHQRSGPPASLASAQQEKERIRELERLSKFSYFNTGAGSGGVETQGAGGLVRGPAASVADSICGDASGSLVGGTRDKMKWQEQLDQMISHIKRDAAAGGGDRGAVAARTKDVHQIYATAAPGSRPLSAGRRPSPSSSRERPRSAGRPSPAPAPRTTRRGATDAHVQERGGMLSTNGEVSAGALSRGPVFTPPSRVDYSSSGTRMRPVEEPIQEPEDTSSNADAFRTDPVGVQNGVQEMSSSWARTRGSGASGNTAPRAVSPVHSTSWPHKAGVGADWGQSKAIQHVGRDASLLHSGPRSRGSDAYTLGGGWRNGSPLHASSHESTLSASHRPQRHVSPYARNQASHKPAITGLKYGSGRYPSPSRLYGANLARPSSASRRHSSNEAVSRHHTPTSRGRNLVGASWDSSPLVPSQARRTRPTSRQPIRYGSPGTFHVPDSRAGSIYGAVRVGAGGGAGVDAGSYGSVAASYEALMADLEASRKRAEVARHEILSRKALWESDFMR